MCPQLDAENGSCSCFVLNFDIVNSCDEVLEINQFGTKHSLNVSIAAGIVIWSFFKLLDN